MGWVVVNLFTPRLPAGVWLLRMLCSFCWVNIIHAIGGDPDAALATQDAESKEDGENQNARMNERAGRTGHPAQPPWQKEAGAYLELL